jgi:hypothetical protein
MMNEMINYIDFDKIAEIAFSGVRRAAVFMGLGLNSGLNPEFHNYELTSLAQIQLIPSSLPDEKIQHFKEEFCKWIITCGLRELIETYNLFLDNLYHVCLILETNFQHLTQEDILKRTKEFNNNGLSKKIQKIEGLCKLEFPSKNCLLSLQKARNCLAHRRGVVSSEDFTDNDQCLIIQWRGLRVWAEEPDGTQHELGPILKEPVCFRNGAIVNAQQIIRSKSFINGDIILFQPHELAEICWFFLNSTKFVCRAIIEYYKQKGVVILK